MDMSYSPSHLGRPSHDNDRRGHGDSESKAAEPQSPPCPIDTLVGLPNGGLSPLLAPIPFVGLTKTLEP